MATNLELRIPTGVPLTNQQIDDNFQRCTWAKGTDLTASSTLTLQDGYNYYDVSGTSDIEAIGAVCKGYVVRLHFKGSAATNGIVHADVSPGIYCNSSSTDVLYAANDIVTIVQETDAIGGANALWRILSYHNANGSEGQFIINPTTLDNIVLQDGTGGIADAGVGIYNLNRQIITFSSATMSSLSGGGSTYSAHSIVDENSDPAMPHEIHAYAVCTASNGSWAINDMVPIASYRDNTSGNNYNGGSISCNISPNARVYVAVFDNGWKICDVTGDNDSTDITDGNWKVEVHLIRYNPVNL